jgi:hypothetical protein
MPARRQIMVQPPADRMTGGSGKADLAVLQAAFPGSPVYSGDIDDTYVTEQYMNIVTNAVVNDGGHTFGTVDLNYTGAPNLEEVEVGGGGLPGSPYAPNIASPPVGQNPADIPASGVEATNRARGSGGAFNSVPGTGDAVSASPNNTAAVISRQTVGSLLKGTSTPTG